MRLVVVGGGPAGVEAAKTAAPFADVTLVAAEPVGSWRPLATRVLLARWLRQQMSQLSWPLGPWRCERG